MKKSFFVGWKLYTLVGAVTLLVFGGAFVVLRIAAQDAVKDMPKFSTPAPRFVHAYQIELGMTTQEVEDLFGRPDDKSTYKSDAGLYITYTYKNPSGKIIMIDFEKGEVTSVGEY